jgi:glycosyltransferase involved in cell wall biosynthesis
MTEETALKEQARQRIAEIGQADILVGIPSYNNADTIGHVVQTAGQGMTTYFPDMKPVLINSDGGSEDGTRQVALDTPVPEEVEVITAEYEGIPGKGSAFRAVFEAAEALGAKVCVVVDSDLRSITPGWIERLAGPIVKAGYGYVTPYYVRHKYDATITNNICYPMTRMLYGLAVRQPIGGDFGVSAELVDQYLTQDVWETDVARFGIDIWMTTTAINAGFDVCQAYLGAKIHDAKDPSAALGPMFRQVVGTLFGLMDKYEDNWKTAQPIESAPIVGERKDVSPEPVDVSLSGLIEKFKDGQETWSPFWEGFLSTETQNRLKAILTRPVEEYQFGAEEWAPIVFDFAVAYNKSGLGQDQIIDSMTPLYYGRTAGLVVESKEMDNTTFEQEVIQAQARTFEDLRPYLLARWEQAEGD